MGVQFSHFKWLLIFFCIVHGIAVSTAAAASRPWNSKDYVQTTKKYKKKPIVCFRKNNKFQVGYKAKLGRKKVWIQYTSKADKKALKKLGYPADCEQSGRVNEPSLTATPTPIATPTPTATATPTSTPCVPQLRDISLEVTENQKAEISPQIVAANFCSGMQLSVVEQPEHGVIQSSSDGVAYLPFSHFIGSDSVRVGLLGSSETAQVTLNVVMSAPEFAGNAESLEPYREHLTSAEVFGLLKRVALGGDETLYNIGVTQGRSALIEALLTTPTSETIRELSEATGEVFGHLKVGFPDVTGNRRMWEVPTTRVAWGVELIKGSPLQQVAMMNLHDHFAANLSVVRGPDQIGLVWPIKDHYLKLRHYALGSLDEFLREMNYDTVMGWSLDNRLNQWSGGQTGNFNYGREMLEKFTVGRFDMYAPAGMDTKPGQLPNYDEDDVAASAKLLSGFYSMWPAYGEQRGFQDWNTDPQTGIGYNGMDLDFSVSSAFPDEISIFGTRPEASSYSIRGASGDPGTSATVEEYMDLLLYEHPATAKRLAYSIFGRFAIPHASESLIEDLAVTVAASNYNMTDILRRVLNSSAMFTTQAMEGCIKSPLEHLSYVLRRLNLPLGTNHMLSRVEAAMTSTGMIMFEPATVFGFHMCGDPLQPGKGNHGETWLSTQLLLNRGRAIFDILKRSQSSQLFTTYFYMGSMQEAGENVSLRSLYFGSWQNFSAAQVVDRMAAIFHMELPAAERTLLIDYLSASDAWDPTNVARVEEKLRGLSFIFGMHPKSIT